MKKVKKSPKKVNKKSRKKTLNGKTTTPQVSLFENQETIKRAKLFENVPPQLMTPERKNPQKSVSPFKKKPLFSKQKKTVNKYSKDTIFEDDGKGDGRENCANEDLEHIPINPIMIFKEPKNPLIKLNEKLKDRIFINILQ